MVEKADGSVIFKVDVDDKQAQKELNSLEKKIDTLQEKLNAKNTTRDSLFEQANNLGAQLDAAKERLEKMKSGGEFFTMDSIKQQENAVVSMEKEWASINNKLDKVNTQISEGEAELERMKTKAGETAAKLAGAKKETSGMSDAAKAASAQMDKFSRRVKTLAKRVLVFSLITKALSSFKDYVWESIQTNKEAMAAIAKLKGALLTLAQPLINVLIPVFTVLVNVLTRVINTVSKFVSLITGTSVDASAKAAKSLYEQKKAINGVGNAAKKANRSLASFDELTVLSNSSSNASSSITPDFETGINDQLSAIASLFVGAALLGIGAILTFSGANIGLGLALMVMGGLAIWSAVSENWGEISSVLQGELGLIVGYVSAAALAIGLILLFSGANIGLGLGLVALGAVGLASVIAANWDSVEGPLTKTLNELAIVAAGAALVIGLVLILTGANVLLGLGLLVAGAAGLAGWIAANWDFIVDKFKEIWNNVKSWWKTNVAPIFTAQWWKNLGKRAIDWLLSGIKNAWQAVVSWVKSAVEWVKNIFSGLFGNTVSKKSSFSSGGFGGSRMRTQEIPAISSFPIPALAQGAVIPPNREFLAVLGDQKRGTNIEAPLETIQQAFLEMGPQFAQAIVSAFIATGMIGNIQAIEDYTRATAAKEFSLGQPNSTAGRWIAQSSAAYAKVKG